jgi:selenocysteine lyase/cysteine desulfurase
MSAIAAPVETFFSELRRSEFARLDRDGMAYLDYAGSGLYAESQLAAHHAMLASGVFGNPHSESSPSLRSTRILDDAREQVLRFLDADAEQYVVCFTANASAAIKLVAESYPWSSDSQCVLSTDNHNSVNGVREYARRAGARVTYVPVDHELRSCGAEAVLAGKERSGSGLFAFPAQSNFSGVRHSLRVVHTAHEFGFDVLLDAAALLPTCALSLSRFPADFVALSFYKLFGYPTGIGALVARRDALSRLRRPWFAGGTVEYASVQNDRHQLRAGGEGFEDGTPNFLAASALSHGFAFLDRVGIDRIGTHVVQLTSRLLRRLVALSHDNGRPLVRLYGPLDTVERGGTIAFNVLARDGRPVPYADVECRARNARVAIRGGCFCNPGASEAAFRFDARRALACVGRLGADFTVRRFAACMGDDVAVGAVRASMGVASNTEDVDRIVEVVASFADR